MLEDVAVLAFNEMKDGRRYTVRLRGRLDIEALPLPMRPVAYLKPDWSITSDVWAWQLKP